VLERKTKNAYVCQCVFLWCVCVCVYVRRQHVNIYIDACVHIYIDVCV